MNYERKRDALRFRHKRGGLRVALVEALRYAAFVSLLNPKATVRVLLGRGPEWWPTAIHIEGHAVDAGVIDRAREEGRRFKPLATFKAGNQL